MSEQGLGWKEASRRRFNAWARGILARLGVHVDRTERVPRYNLLGLRRYGFASIIDVGANEGQFARRIRADFPTAALYCFEPLPEPFARLAEWARLAGNAHVFNVALGERKRGEHALAREALALFFDPANDCSLDRALPFTATQREVPVTVKTLDGEIEGLVEPLARPLLVKMDVQGYEARVIRGGRRVLGTADACIIEISLVTFYEGQSTFSEIVNELDDLGFRYAGNLSQVHAKTGEALYVDAVFVCRREVAATG